LLRILRGSANLLILLALLLSGCITEKNDLPKPIGRGTPPASESSTLPPEPTPEATEEITNQETPLQSEQILALGPEAQDMLGKLTDAPQYFLSLEVDYPEPRFQGNLHLLYTNTENVPLEKLVFRLYPNGKKSYGNGSLDVISIQQNGKSISIPASPDPTQLEVPLNRPLEPGEKTELDMAFKGEVPSDETGSEGLGYGIYNLQAGVLTLSGWFPLLAVYDASGWHTGEVSYVGDSVFSDIAFFEAKVTTPTNVVIASSGVETAHNERNNLTVHQYVSGPSRDFTLVMSPDLQVSHRQVGSILVNSYALPGNSEGGTKALDLASESLKTYQQFFGPYPYTEFDIVEAPMNYALGVEYPGLAIINSQLYQKPQDPTFEVSIAHEVAHQWWYNVVGNDVINEPWLDESLATYSSGLAYAENHQLGTGNGYFNFLSEKFRQRQEQGLDGPINQSLTAFEAPDNPDLYSNLVYTKGALFLDALNEYIGSQAFMTGLRQYYHEYSFEIATTQDLLAIFEAAAGKPLDEFYASWFTLPGSEATSPPSPDLTISFAVIGDYGSGDENELAVAELVKSWKPNFILTLGDNNYPLGSAETIDDHVGKFYSSFISPYQGAYDSGAVENAFFPSLGNHDWNTPSAAPYLDYFSLPGNERYYDFVIGPVHFFALDSDSREPDGVSSDSIQAGWLKERLAASQSPWKIVFGHHPPYSSGYHGSVKWMRWPFQEWGASIYLSGHDHTYERLEEHGFPYIVNGLGGGAIYRFTKPLKGSQVRYNQGYGAMLVIANLEQITFQFITIEGDIIDTFVLKK
jgi:hypothetical protein